MADMPDISGIAALVGDPARIAAGIVALLRDDAAWRRASALGARYAAARFSPAAMGAALLDACGLPQREEGR